MNIFEALRESHERQRDLSEKLIKTSGMSEERKQLFEDLKNEQFLKELFKIGLIDDADQKELATFSKGINI